MSYTTYQSKLADKQALSGSRIDQSKQLEGWNRKFARHMDLSATKRFEGVPLLPTNITPSDYYATPRLGQVQEGDAAVMAYVDSTADAIYGTIASDVAQIYYDMNTNVSNIYTALDNVNTNLSNQINQVNSNLGNLIDQVNNNLGGQIANLNQQINGGGGLAQQIGQVGDIASRALGLASTASDAASNAASAASAASRAAADARTVATGAASAGTAHTHSNTPYVAYSKEARLKMLALRQGVRDIADNTASEEVQMLADAVEQLFALQMDYSGFDAYERERRLDDPDWSNWAVRYKEIFGMDEYADAHREHHQTFSGARMDPYEGIILITESGLSPD